MKPEWAMSLPWNLMVIAAKASELDIDLVAAICMAESFGRPWMTSYDSTIKNFCTPDNFARIRGISSETERVHQQTRWGFMQVTGAAARELNFLGDLPELSRPSAGLRWGCARLKLISEKFGCRVIEDLASAWNAGKPLRNADGTYVNQRFVVSVMRYYDQLTG